MFEGVLLGLGIGFIILAGVIGFVYLVFKAEEFRH